MPTLADLLTIAPSPYAFEATCVWLESHPDHEDAPTLLNRLAGWAPDVRILHDAQGWNLAIEPRPWSALIDGLVFFDWGPWDEAFEQLATCTHLTGLRHLEAHQGRLTEAGAAALAASDLLPRIEHLVLTKVSLNAAAAGVLATGLGPVRWLDVSANPLTDAGLAPLITAVAPTLEVLDAGRADLIALTGLIDADLPRLRTLQLPMNPLSVATAQRLGTATWMPNLQSLELTLSLHTDAHLAALIEGGIGAHDVDLDLKYAPLQSPATVHAYLQSPHPALRTLGAASVDGMSKSDLKTLAKLMGGRALSRLSKADLTALITAAVSESLEG